MLSNLKLNKGASEAGDDAANNTGRARNNIKPNSNASGDHSVFKTDTNTGKVTNYKMFGEVTYSTGLSNTKPTTGRAELVSQNGYGGLSLAGKILGKITTFAYDKNNPNNSNPNLRVYPNTDAGLDEFAWDIYVNNEAASTKFLLDILDDPLKYLPLVLKGAGALKGGGSVDDFLKSNVHKDFQNSVKSAFGSDAKVTTLIEDKIVYRYYGNGSNAKSFWVTPNQYSNPSSSLSLPSVNSFENMVTYTIPKGTTILEGTVAPAFGQPGGGYQIFVPNPSILK